MAPVAVHHEVEGPEDAPILVLSSSLGTTAAMWDPQMADLRRFLRVLRYDMRGHGASPVPPGPYELADLGGDVLAVLDRLGIERASFCGLSIGGMVGMWLAVHAPDRIERLVLCCTSAHLPPAEAWARRAVAVRAAQSTAVVADAVLERWLTSAFVLDQPEVVAWLRAILLDTSPAGYAGCCAAIEAMDLRGELSSIAAPTLVIAAREDLAIPPAHGQAISDAVRGARLEVVSHAAHLANVERPDAITHLILDHVFPEGQR